MKHDIKDLLPLLREPLWEGADREFARYVRESFGVPPGLDTVTITARSPRGRSAVSIGNADAGAILFVITPDRHERKTRIPPFVLGPLVKNGDVLERVHQSDADADAKAISALALRHLAKEVVLDLLTPSPIH